MLIINVIISAAASIVCISIAAYTLRRHGGSRITMRSYAALAALGGIIPLLRVAAVFGPTPGCSRVFLNIQETCFAFLTSLWAYFVFRTFVSRNILPRILPLLLFFIPVVTQACLWTNDYHGLWSPITAQTAFRGISFSNLTTISYTGPAQTIHIINSFFCVFGGLALLCLRAPTIGAAYTRDMLIAAAGGLCIGSGTIIATFIPGLALDPVPVSITIGSFIFAWGMYRRGLYSALPLPDVDVPNLTAVTILFYTASLIIIVGLSISFHLFYSSEERKIRHEISLAASLNTTIIKRWIDEGIGDGTALAENKAFHLHALSVIAGRATPHEQMSIEAWLSAMNRAYHYSSIILCDARGATVLSFPHDASICPTVRSKLADIARFGVRIIVFHQDFAEQEFHASLVVPLTMNADAAAYGFVVATYDLSRFSDSMMDLHYPGIDAEVDLIQPDGNIVLAFTKAGDRALVKTVDLDRSDDPLALAAAGRQGLVRGMKTDNIPVIAGIQPIEGSTWRLLVMVEEDQIYAAARSGFAIQLFITMLLILAISLTIFITWRERSLAAKAKTGVLLAKSEAKYRHLFNTMRHGVVYQDATGHIIDANPAAERILGLTFDQMIGRTSHDPRWRAIRENGMDFPGDEHPAMVSLRTGRDVENEIMGVYNPKDKTTHWIRIYATPLFEDESGSPSGVFTTFEDITDIQEMKKKLLFQYELLNTIINAIHTPIFFKNTSLVYTGCNKAFEDFIGLPMSEILGKTVFDVAPRDLAEIYEAMDRALLASGGTQEYAAKVKNADGGLRDVIFYKSCFRGPDGAIGGIVGVMLDITELRRAQEAVREAEAFATGAINALDSHIAIFDETGTILSVNEAWRTFSRAHGGDDARTCEGANIFEACASASGDDADTARAFIEGLRLVIEGTIDRFSMEYPCHSPNQKRWFIGTVTRFAGEGPPKFVAAHTNITERKLAEERIVRSLEEKEILLREIHHRVKNNLQVITSLIGLQSIEVTDESFRSAMRDIQARIKSMAVIHEQLYRSGDFTAVNMREFVNILAAGLFQNYALLENRISIRPEIDDIRINLEQAVPCGLILNELLTNALKHAFPNGTSGEILVRMRRSDTGEAVLTVKDSGIGLPEDFDPEDVNSLGIRLVRILTRQIEGRLEARNDGGAEFTVTFPLQEAAHE